MADKLTKRSPLEEAVTKQVGLLGGSEHEFALETARRSSGMIVVDEDSKNAALESLRVITDEAKRVAEFVSPIKDQLNGAKKLLLKLSDDMVADLDKTAAHLKRQLSTYRALQERVRTEAEKRHEDALSATDGGPPPVDPIEVTRPVESLKGAGITVQVRKLKRLRVTSPLNVIEWWLNLAPENRPLGVIEINESQLLKLLPAYPGGIPGTEVYEKISEAVS